jgi:hypothetical protein
MKTKSFKLMLALAAAGTMFTLSSCEKENMGEGSMTVAMTDAPADYASLNVQIDAVSIYHEDAGWINLNQESKTVSVLDLRNGLEADISSQAQVKAGHYNKIRLTFGDANSLGVWVNVGGVRTMVNANLRFSGSSEVILETDIDVKANAETKMLLDFDAGRSVIDSAGTYVLKPVIRELTETGTGVKGRVTGTATAYIYLSDGSNSFSTYIGASGEFLLRGVKPGTYVMEIHKAATSAEPNPQPMRIEGVVVAKGSITDAGQFDI